MNLRRWIALLWFASTLSGGTFALAQSSVPSSKLPIPPGLPRYEMDVRIDVDRRIVRATERVTFTNRTSREVTELVFHVYPTAPGRGS